MADAGHRAVEAVTYPAESCRLLLARDGAYEPLEDSCVHLADFLIGDPQEAARGVVHGAIDRAGPCADNASALVVDVRP